MIEIRNLRKEKPQELWDVRVDRSSFFGNKFIITIESERDTVCEQYEKWFYEQLSNPAMQAELIILKSIYRQHGKLNLFCWCAPQRCHAETIRNYLLEVQT